MSKYNAKKTVLDGITFDSRKEGARYLQLKAMQGEGKIAGLALQPEYELIPSQWCYDGKKKRCLFRAVKYRADFEYFTADGEKVTEDVKGFKTPVYKLKKALLYYRHGILIKEV